jgi:GAF domain-containing protein
MQTILTRIELFLKLNQYTDLLDRNKARLLLVLMSILLLAFYFYAFFVPDWQSGEVNAIADQYTLLTVIPLRPGLIVLIVLPVLAWFALIVLIRFRYLAAARYLMTAALFGILVVPPVVLETASYGEISNVVYLLVFVLMSILINEVRWVIPSVAVGIIVYIVDGTVVTPGSTFTIPISVIFLGMIGYAFLSIAQTSRRQGEDLAALDRTRLAELTTKLSRLGSQRTVLREALDGSLALIQETYPQFYHIQVFIIESGGVQAELIASTGDVGQKLLARKHSLAVGSLSTIGQSTFKATNIVAYAGVGSTPHRPNELLPNTKTEIAFPLIVQGKVIGALDFQSEEIINFSDIDLSLYQSVADSLALVIDNVRQVEMSQARIEENRHLAEQARNALAEVQRLNKRLIGRAWTDYLKDYQHMTGIEANFIEGEQKPLASWTPSLSEAIQKNQTLIQGGTVTIPLMVRGQVVGALEIEREENTKFSQEELDFLQEVSERFGLAAENTRLIEQSQRSAQREALINVVSSRLQTANNVEATMAEAARSLSELLQAERVAIRLGTPPPRTNTRGFGE